MRQGMTMQQLAAEVQRQHKAKADYIADSRKLTLLPPSSFEGGQSGTDNPNWTVEIDGVGSFDCNSLFLGQITGKVGVPRKFAQRLMDEPQYHGLLTRTVNTILRHEPSKRMVRTLDRTARAYVSSHYRVLDNAHLAEFVLPELMQLGDEVRFESCQLTDKRMYIKAVFPGITGEIEVGDPVCAGVVISNSEVGAGSLSAAALVYRLVCKNGMIVPDSTHRRYHVGRAADDSEDAYQVFSDETKEADIRAVMLKFRDVVKAAVDEAKFQSIVSQMKDATKDHIPAGNVVDAVERVSNHLELTGAEHAGVLEHLIAGGDLSRYGMLNAVTRASQDVEDYDRATDLERAGGRVLEMPAAAWDALVG